jgi:hypothetical protein
MKFQNNSFHSEFKVHPQPGLQAGQQMVKESKGQDKVHRRSKSRSTNGQRKQGSRQSPQKIQNVSKKHPQQLDKYENTISSPEPIQELQVDQISNNRTPRVYAEGKTRVATRGETKPVKTVLNLKQIEKENGQAPSSNIQKRNAQAHR